METVMRTVMITLVGAAALSSACRAEPPAAGSGRDDDFVHRYDAGPRWTAPTPAYASFPTGRDDYCTHRHDAGLRWSASIPTCGSTDYDQRYARFCK
jgi:hypothetical protein